MESFRTRFYKPTLAVLVLALFFSVSRIQSGLNTFRDERGLTRITHLENAPPLLAFTTVALGGFRGLIANTLWSRVSDLQMEGKYFEMVQLSDWISKLTPTFDDVWVHLAWNMSYNISVKYEDPADRWQWVERGIELLRDEGLKYNPNSVNLYRELAWHFQHKMGQNLDDAHLYYKRAWAFEMEELLGEKPDWEALINPQTDEEKEKVRKLKEVYKLDPVLMKKVDETYGPLEWRLPETHAIYWAMKGIDEVERRYRNDPEGFKAVYDKEFITLRRVIYQSMQLAFRRGRLVRLNVGEDYSAFDFGPNLEMVENANRAYEEMMAQDEEWREHISTGHKNMIEEAAWFFYTYNRMEEAKHWFAYLKEKYPDALGPNTQNMTIEDFAIAQISEIANETDRDRVKSILEGFIQTAFINLAVGGEDYAIQVERQAKLIHQEYVKAISRVSDPNARLRVELPPYELIKRDVLNQLLAPDSEIISPYVQDLLRTALGLPSEDLDRSLGEESVETTESSE